MHSSIRRLSSASFMVVVVLMLAAWAPTITAAQSNSAPVAEDDTYLVNEDDTLRVFSPGVLINDTDPDNDELVAILEEGPANGELLPQGSDALGLTLDGAFTYVPNPGFRGADQFTYRADDGTTSSDLATVVITVNGRPTAEPDAYTVDVNSTLEVAEPGVLDNDTDPEGDELFATLVEGPDNGTLTPQGIDNLEIGPDGGFIYTPNTDFVGTDSFIYRVSDTNAASSTAEVTIEVVGEVNEPPVAVADEYRVAQDGELSRSVPFSLLENDFDPNGDALTATLVQAPSNGTLLDQEGTPFPPDGDFVYTPASGFAGTDTFTYQVSDGELTSNEAPVTITVSEPPNAQPDAYTVARSDTLEVPAPGVLQNDTDPEGDELSAALVNGPTNGELLFIQEAESRLAPSGAFTYVPNTDFTGTDSFTYQADDGLSTDQTTVTITVEDVLTVQDDLYTVSQEDTLEVSDSESVLSNDSSVDGAVLTASLQTSPENGTLIEQSPGEPVLTPDGTFTYVPNDGFIGTDTFTYLADDGTSSGSATVSITVNGRPQAISDAYELRDDEILTVTAPGVLANDTDPEGDVLTATVVSLPTGGTLSSSVGDNLIGANGSFNYSPAPGFSGVDVFTYFASDPSGGRDTTTVTLTVIATNEAPVAEDDTYLVNEDDTLQVFPPGVLINDTDADNDDLIAILEEEPTNGELLPQGSDALGLTLDGAFTYVPNPGFRGADQFTYRADDGTATSGLGIVVITVNGRPTAESDAYTVNVNSTLEVSAPGVLENDSDPEGDELFATLVKGPGNGTLTPQGIDNLEIATDGGFIYTPNTDFVGIDSFIYRVSDTNSASSTAEVTIEVQAQCQYTVVGLGTLGGTVSRAVDINNAGEIVGFSETADGSVRGFIWSGGEITTVAPDQINQTFAIDEDIAGTADINGTFQAVRFSGIETTPQGPADAFSIAFGTSRSRSVGTYVEDETFLPFVNDNGFAALPVPEGRGGRAMDVNANGLVAGYSLSERALRWELGEVTDLGPGRAYGINDRGQVVGRSSERAVQWEFDGTPTILGDDERFAEAYDINTNGTVVGSSILVTDTSQTATLRNEEAIRLSSWRTTRDLAQLAQLVSHQRTLSSSGASALPKRTPLGAAYRFQFGIASDLNECIPSGAGWVLEEARAINDLGQIVGFGLLNETQQAFLLTPEHLNAQSNTAPEARQDRIQTTFGEPVDLQFAQERRDANGDSLLLARVFTPEEGTIRQDINGAYQYHPRAGYSGSDRFTYVVTNGKGATAKNTVSVDISAPDQFVLEANAPNPFRGQTVIRFTLPSKQHVRLDVYDILGRRVASLLDASLPPGQHRTLFDAAEMSSGVYFYRIRTDGYVETRKMVVVR